MGFLDIVKDALKGAVTSQSSKDEAARREAAAKDDVVAGPPVAQEAREDAREQREDVPEAKAAKFENYTVRTGDSLPEIGARFGVSHLEIAALNNIENPDLIFPGQVFRIPTS